MCSVALVRYNTNMAKKSKETQEEIYGDIRDALHLHASFRFIFLQGMVKGFGTVFGATVLVAIATSLAIKFGDAVFLGEIIKAFTHTSFE
jgi:hypothetical protein